MWRTRTPENHDGRANLWEHRNVTLAHFPTRQPWESVRECERVREFEVFSLPNLRNPVRGTAVRWEYSVPRISRGTVSTSTRIPDSYPSYHPPSESQVSSCIPNMSFVIGFEVVDPTATGRTGPVRKRASKPKVRSGCVTCKYVYRCFLSANHVSRANLTFLEPQNSKVKMWRGASRLQEMCWPEGGVRWIPEQ